MKSTDQIIQHFNSSAKLFSDHKDFSAKPGIYGVHYFGKSDTLGAIVGLKSGQIIYLGKTESSQKSRDADTHFKTGQSGRSTLRRVIGAFLREELNLKPIPRGSGESKIDITNYRFDDITEDILTKWMIAHLGLSFFEYPKSPAEILELEKKLIKQVCPCMNIQYNRQNPFLNEVNIARATCRNLAKLKLSRINTTIKNDSNKIVEPKKTKGSAGVHKYEVIWKGVMSFLKESLLSGGEIKRKQLDKNEFGSAGERDLYSFNIQYQNGNLINTLKGSAVARDLDRMINRNADIKKLLNDKNVKLTMGKDFIFKVEMQ